ncbi:MAG TPA: hypothetical protein VHG08_27210, partial [Longimicrobium sp.]|nr:hypothetical protein [Longimicrobium sp.]
VAVVGETPVRAMETGFELVRTLVTQGPAAAWQQIVEGISNLRDMVMGQVTSFIQSRVVQAAITTITASLVPGAGFIRAIIAIYDTVTFVVQRLRQIGQVVAAYVDSIAAIASGNIGTAANRVETTMAGMLTLVISFLAQIARLGNVSAAVRRIIDRVRQPVFRALDRVVNWIVAQARRLGRFVAQAGVPQDPVQRLNLAMAAAQSAVSRFSGRRAGALVLRPLLQAVRVRYGMRSLEPVARGNRWAISGEVNPARIVWTEVEVGDIAVTPVPQASADALTAVVRQQQEAYRRALSSPRWQASLGWCFAQAVTLGINALANPNQGVEILLIRLTPRRPRQRLRPAEERAIETEFVRDVRWLQHVVVSVNGHIFDYEADQQQLPLPAYLNRMFPGQNPHIERTGREDIIAAALSLQGRRPR